MSSSSEDEFSYTNAVSILKSLKNKDISIPDDDSSSPVGDIFALNDSPIPAKHAKKTVTRSKLKKTLKTPEEIIEIPPETIDLDTSQPSTSTNTCISLSDDADDEVNSSVDIISKIDNFLEDFNGGKSKRGRKKGSRSKRSLRSNKTKQQPTYPPEEPPIQIDLCADNEPTVAIDDENYDVSVKVWWQSQRLEKFSIRRFEKISRIFEYFSDKENVPQERLLFTIREQIITPNDTPDSLNITAATIIEGGILSAKINFTVPTSHGNDDKIELKVLTKDRKHPFVVKIKPDDKMSALMHNCAEEFKTPVNNLKFFFDGDLIKPNETPESLQLDGGECIDCVK